MDEAAAWCLVPEVTAEVAPEGGRVAMEGVGVVGVEVEKAPAAEAGIVVGAASGKGDVAERDDERVVQLGRGEYGGGVSVEPEAGKGALEKQVERGASVIALYGCGALVGQEKIDGRGVEQAVDGVVIDVCKWVVLGATLSRFHAADAGERVAGR